MTILRQSRTVINIQARFIAMFCVLLLASCASSKKVYDPKQKYAPEKLKQDYTIFRRILETSHPSIYWYTGKDSMDYYFDAMYLTLHDSLTELQFRDKLAFVISKIDCGHTSMKGSKGYARYMDTVKTNAFPLAMKFWSDTMVITANLRRGDPVFSRGTIIQSINGYTASELTDTLFNYITTDGYSISGKYQSLSTGFAFASLYKNIFGLHDSISIEYLDNEGIQRKGYVTPYNFKADTMNKQTLSHGPPVKGPKKPKEKQDVFLSSVNLQLDTVMKTAFMTVSTFSRSYHLKRFFKKAFKTLRQTGIRNLIIDVRSNGGGDAGLSTLLTQYIIDHKFRMADSLYTIKPPSEYKKYIQRSLWHGLLVDVITKKKKDGKYHFTYFEKHTYRPRTNNHFEGQVYILIGGNSFSATTLFAGDLKGQKNVTLVGEETGGGYYGNTAWIIPDVTLPNTGLRFRLPRFRMVVDKNRIKNGRGVMPDVWAVPTPEAIRDGIDFKAMKVKELIEQQQQNGLSGK